MAENKKPRIPPATEVDETLVIKKEADNKLPAPEWAHVDTNSFLNQEYESDSRAYGAGPKLEKSKAELPAAMPPSRPPPPKMTKSKIEVAPVAKEAPVADIVWDNPATENWGEAVSLEVSAQASTPDWDVGEKVIAVAAPSGHTRMETVSAPENFSEPVSESHTQHSPLNDADMQVLKRYGTLKEREAREKDAAAQVLRKQIEQLDERLKRSDGERRRLLLQLEEAEAKIRAFKDGRDQDKHHLTKLEQQHQEELRALQLRFDNAQFQASKAEKKLEEFRERVRNDIQRIRSRERELANRLELQKRDAEALLTAKDERLLQLKREIDRMEFEIEGLKERFVEETQKAEERAGKLTRALQSLRLAAGMLSGMEEEVLPGAFSAEGGDGEGEAA